MPSDASRNGPPDYSTVIDLRETYTVGPFIKLLDPIIETVAPWYHQSTLKRGVDAAVALGERAAETRVGELLTALLEPPEPPAEDEREQNATPTTSSEPIEHLPLRKESGESYFTVNSL